MKLVSYILVFLLVSCDQGAQMRSADTSNQNSSEEAVSSSDQTEKKEDPRDKNALDPDDIGINTDVEEGDIEAGSIPQFKGPVVPKDVEQQRLKDALTHFDVIVKPAFQAECSSCHKPARFNPPAGATEEIFEFNYGFTRMSDEGGPAGSRLVQKLLGFAPHGGEDICKKSIKNEPCGKLLIWWQIAFGHEDEPMTDGRFRVTHVTADGVVHGVAQNFSNLEEKVEVRIKNGTSVIAKVKADKTGASFTYLVPDSMRDGKAHELSFYAVLGGIETEFSNSPYRFIAYKPDGGVGAFAEVKDKIACSQCHAGNEQTYNDLYQRLSTPPPHDGGAATNNYLFNRLTGKNGHRNICGDCEELKLWWLEEFQK